MKRLSILFLLSVLYSFSAFATLTTGYYKIYNPKYSRYMYEDFTANAVSTSSSYADGEYEKLWKITVSGSNVTLQNVYTGHYIQNQGTTSAQFVTGETSADFTLTTNSDGTTYMFGAYLHCAESQSYNVVKWGDSSNDASNWTVESVSLTDTQVNDIRSEYTAVETFNSNASTYNSSLLTFFTDASCSELKSAYEGYTDDALKSAMKAISLPTSLQDIAVKVKNGWSNETEKNFRVREYQAYSRAYYWRSKLNAYQFTDMNNPTGIYADAKEVVYIFVGGEIPSGCSLRVVGLTGNNQASYDKGTELKYGVNAIQSSAALSHLWIMYTYTGDTDVDMSTLDKLKIHIEGGDVYGFSDVTGLDETAANTNYKTALTAANNMCKAKSTGTSDLCFVVKGNRGVFYFPLDTYNQIWETSPYYTSYSTNYSIYKSIHWFDNVLAWEWGLMGFTKRVVDGQTDEHEHVTGGKDVYTTYCNNLALTLQGADGSNPYSTTGYTSMPGVSGVESSYNAERADFDNWCVGHESGHDNQGAINLPSCTESSNNLFSNVVCYLTGYRMSRGEPVSTTNTDYQSGTQFALRDIGSTHRMYWQLYLYYHEAQNKTSFYPELFESLRNDPMDLNSNTDDCFLKFYQKACDAAGEDLTEFFRGWGFFVPFENTTFGDYTNHTLTLTQEQIDAAIAAVKAKNYPENISIMFIEDRIEESYRWDAWASGTTDVRATQGYAVGQCGDVGSVNDYVKDTSVESANYTSYTLSGNTITMSGSNGAGFLVYDADGNLVAFSNSKSFTIPNSAIAAGFTVKVVNADNTSSVVKSIAETGTADDKLAVLKSVLETAKAIVSATDETETMVGYYRASAITNLSTLVTNANTIISNLAADQYGDMITTLNKEIALVNSNEKAKMQIVSTCYYRLQNNNYTTRFMTDNSSDKLSAVESDLDDYQKWQFVSTGTANQYYIKNKSTGKYINYFAMYTQTTATATSTDDAYKFYVVAQDETGVFGLTTDYGYDYLHCDGSYKIVPWSSTPPSMWKIILVEEPEDFAASSELAELIDKSENLLSRVVEQYNFGSGTTTALTLQTTNSSSAFYISTNNQETTEGQIANLVDGNTSTFFHSTWSATTTDKHYLTVDLGSGNEIDLFSFSMTSRNSNPNNFPSDITIQGSNDGTNFIDIANVTNSLATSGQFTYKSDVLGTDGGTYRYFRFVVNKTGSGNGNNANATYYFFALSEFSMNSETRTVTPEKHSAYSSVDDGAIVSLYKEMNKAITVLANANVTEMNTELPVLQEYYDALLVLTKGSGDVNLDGKVTIADISTLVRILRGYPLSTYGDSDLNEDGSTTIKDVQKLSDIILGK